MVLLTDDVKDFHIYLTHTHATPHALVVSSHALVVSSLLLKKVIHYLYGYHRMDKPRVS